jgi:uncharacterized membrane protein YeaQ/YmgE (transglycosylase-associated protein family)
MGIVDFLLLLLVAAIIGALGQAVGGYSTPGCAMSIVIGFVGALIGRWIQRAFGFPTFWVVYVGDTKFAIVWSVIGAAILVLVLRLLMGRRVVSG